MNIVSEATEHIVWFEFLRRENKQRLDKERWHECEQLIRSPDFSDERQNYQRKNLLDSIRGAITKTIPSDTVWKEVSLSIEEFGTLRLLRYLSWVALSDETCLLSVAANNVSREPMLSPVIMEKLGQSGSRAWAEVAEIRRKVQSMREAVFEPSSRPILVRQVDKPNMTIIEGCHRATVLYLQYFLDSIPFPVDGVRAFLGASSRMTDCGWMAT